MTVLARAAEIHESFAVTRAQALVLAVSEREGRPLDIRDSEAAAVCLRAEHLFIGGAGLDDALRAARCERTHAIRQHLGIPADGPLGAVRVQAAAGRQELPPSRGQRDVPYASIGRHTLYAGDARKTLDELPELGAADMILTSPPYYGQRRYSDKSSEIGHEGDIGDYIARLTGILHADRFRGPVTAWIVIADVFVRKCLQLLPGRLATALVATGWTLRNELVWHKPNALPQSAKDRFTCSTERILLLAKPRRGYYLDASALREPAAWEHWGAQTARKTREATTGGSWQSDDPNRRAGLAKSGSRHPRDLWSISTEPYGGPHPAPFPLALAWKAIVAGCPVGGHVLDPFSGSGTTLLAADRLGRRATGIDLVPAFHDLAIERLRTATQAAVARGQHAITSHGTEDA